MFQALKNFVTNSGNNVIAKEDIRTASDATFTAISQSVIPSFKDVLKEDTYFNRNTNRLAFLENMGGRLGLRTNDPKDVIVALLEFFKDVALEEKNISKLIDNEIGDKVFPKLANAQELAIMKTVSDISSVALYALDMLYYVVMSDDTEYPKIKVIELKEGISAFSGIVSIYIKDFDKHVKALDKVAKTVVKLDSSASLVDKMLSKHGKLTQLPTLNGFSNNPIYHIRLWFVDRDVDKYESLKDKKKLIELKLLELKMTASGKSDGRLTKQIKYYEDRISGIEYDLKDLED